MWIALVVARAATRNRTHGKTTLFPWCEGSVSIEIEHNFNANPLQAEGPLSIRGKCPLGCRAALSHVVSPVRRSGGRGCSFFFSSCAACRSPGGMREEERAARKASLSPKNRSQPWAGNFFSRMVEKRGSIGRVALPGSAFRRSRAGITPFFFPPGEFFDEQH